MKDFSFRMFYNETELFEEFGHYIVTIKKMGVRDNKQFVLRNEKSIIYKRNNRNGNIEIFQAIF